MPDLIIRRIRALAAIPLLMLLHLPLTSAAGQQTKPPEDDEASKEWLETALQLPAAPTAENLITFYNSGSQSFAVDRLSLSVAKDGTVRYTLIATSSSGVKNTSYEAIRCETYEKKLYAFGRTDGTWSASRRQVWDRISNTGANKQHHVLFTEYFCDGTTLAGKAPELLDRLQGKRVPYSR
ncbi:CNP1-like family protein [Undibacterium griseum]|uniref:CNP1-like family protein n=1 Tax=Undibacterium griseum TaxID=2762295 RepID=A0ABR6YNI9_9BURK|nr:CNP1-like family protein [Undibacterium griseum]MBC3885469.1 CNP1-like family protein [Undibacterium griseum]